jgi:hypothetical protein
MNIKSLAYVILLQAAEPRISKVVWGAAILVLLVAATLLIVFFRRLKRSEKEQEEDWSLSRRSLFVEGGGSSNESVTPQTASAEESEDIVRFDETTLYDEVSAPDSQPRSTRITELVEPPVSLEKRTGDDEAPTQPPAPERAIKEDSKANEFNRPVHNSVPTVAPDSSNLPEPIPPPIQREEHPTEVLTSSRPTELLDEDDVFAEDVWADLSAPKPIEPTEPEGPKPPDSGTTYRVRAGEGRQTFEPPAIHPLVGREPFDPPRVEPIVPRQREQIEALRETRLEDQAHIAEPLEPLVSPVETKAENIEGVTVASAGGGRRHKPAGTVLGLPLESASGPLVLGVPSRPKEEVGIGSLSNYGKDISPEGGRGGAIFLLLTVLFAAGAILTYLYVPSVNARVQGIIANLRGGQPEGQPRPAEVPAQAQIYPRTSEANKNIVKARGAVYNISTELLDNLSIEITLEKGEGLPVETKRYPVTPALLHPRQQGLYEFDYDGSQANGYPGGYRVSRLLSGENEVKFVMPGQQRSQ